MKLTKLSLATLIALGAVSTASATPLEEAIKNVDMSGFARYRFTHTTDQGGDATAAKITKRQSDNKKHQFRFITNFKADYDDNFYGVLGLRYSANDGAGRNNDITNTTDTFAVHQFYLGYKIGGTDIKLGKQEVSSLLTSDLVGTGALVTNSGDIVEGLTIGAFAFDALSNNTGWMDGGLWKALPAIYNNYGNLYGALVAGSFDPVSFQLIYANVTKLSSTIALDLAGNFAVSDDLAFNLHAQYAHANAHPADNKDLLKSYYYNNANFYGIEAGTEFLGADLTLGYAGWSVKDHGAATISFEDQGDLIDFGEQISGDFNDYTWLEGKGKLFKVVAGYNITDQVHVELEHDRGTQKTIADRKTGKKEKTKVAETVARAAYQYSKKLKFSGYYSYLTTKANDDKDRSTQIRFEAKYSF